MTTQPTEPAEAAARRAFDEALRAQLDAEHEYIAAADHARAMEVRRDRAYKAMKDAERRTYLAVDALRAVEQRERA